MLRKAHNNVRQMSATWIDRYASDILDKLVELGLENVPSAIRPAIKSGQIDLYLLAAAKAFNGDNWELQGFRILHVNGDDNDVTLANDGIPELINPKQFYHPSATK